MVEEGLVPVSVLVNISGLTDDPLNDSKIGDCVRDVEDSEESEIKNFVFGIIEKGLNNYYAFFKDVVDVIPEYKEREDYKFWKGCLNEIEKSKEKLEECKKLEKNAVSKFREYIRGMAGKHFLYTEKPDIFRKKEHGTDIIWHGRLLFSDPFDENYIKSARNELSSLTVAMLVRAGLHRYMKENDPFAEKSYEKLKELVEGDKVNFAEFYKFIKSYKKEEEEEKKIYGVQIDSIQKKRKYIKESSEIAAEEWKNKIEKFIKTMREKFLSIRKKKN